MGLMRAVPDQNLRYWGCLCESLHAFYRFSAGCLLPITEMILPQIAENTNTGFLVRLHRPRPVLAGLWRGCAVGPETV